MRIARLQQECGLEAVYHCVSHVTSGTRPFTPAFLRQVRSLLLKIADFSGIDVLVYSLLPDHFHLLVRIPVIDYAAYDNAALAALLRQRYGAHPIIDYLYIKPLLANDPAVRGKILKRLGNLSSFMKELKQQIAIEYHVKEGGRGTIWAERFKSLLVENSPGPMRILAAYIILNSVRKNLCLDPRDYGFCSYSVACGGGEEERQGLMVATGTDCWRNASRDIREVMFGPQHNGEPILPPSAEAVEKAIEGSNGDTLSLPEILRCRIRYFSDGAVYGSASFVEEFRKKHSTKLAFRQRWAPRPLKGADFGGLTVLRRHRRTPVVAPAGR